MIHHTNLRFFADARANEYPNGLNQSEYDQTVEDALYSLLVGEIAYGGYVKEATETKLVIETNVFACRDLTVFEGPKEEMLELHKAMALCHKYALSLDEQAEFVVRETHGLPLLVVHAGPLLVGRMVLLRVFAHMLGVPVDKLGSIRLEDVLPVAQLLREGHSIQDVQGLLG